MSQMTILSVYLGKDSAALENGKYGAWVRDQGDFGRLPWIFFFFTFVKQGSQQQKWEDEQNGELQWRQTFS